MNSNTKALLALVGAAIAGGGIPVFSKLALSQTNPTEMMTLRFLFAAIIFFPFIRRSLPRKIADWGLISLGMLPAAINATLFAYGIKLTSANIPPVIYALTPITTLIIAVIIKQDTINTKKLAGILIGFGGILTMMILPLLNDHLAGFSGNLFGNSLMLIGMVFWSIYIIVSKFLNRLFSPSVISFIMILTMLGFNLILGGYSALNPHRWLDFSISTWIGFTYLSLIGSLGFFLLYQFVIKIKGPIIASISSYLQPLSTFFFSYLILQEQLNWLIIAGAGMILTGAYLTTKTKG